MTAFVVHWDDGLTDTYATAGDVTHTYADGPASPLITVDLVDEDGTHLDAGALAIEVTNVSPTGVLSNDGPVEAGSQASVAFSAQTDPSPVDTAIGFLYSWDFTNDGVFEVVSSAIPTELVPLSLTATGPGIVTVRGRIADKDGGYTDYLTEIEVNASPPTVDAGDDQSVVEGDLVSLDPATITDPGAPNVFSATVDWGDGIVTGGSVDQVADTVSGSHVYADNGTYTVLVTICDEFAVCASDTLTVAVANADPAFTAFDATTPAVLGAPFDLSFGFEDAGFDNPALPSEETFSATVDWGDGLVETLSLTTVAGSAGLATIGTGEASHAYGVAQEYTIIVTVEDDDGGQAVETITLVVHAPGKFTGGGSINADGTTTSAKGKKNTAAASHGFQLFFNGDGSFGGNFQYNDHRTGDVFHATELTSVVFIDDGAIDAGKPSAAFDTAIVEGIGRLNGVDGVRFRVVMTDAGEPGGNDFFHIEFPDDESPGIAGALLSGNHQAH